MACRRIGALASAYLDGTLAGPERKRFEAHAGECPDCHAHLEELRLVVRASARLRPETGASVTAPQYAAAVEALRHHGRPAARDRILDVPLGIGDQTAAFGDHIVYPWESEREFVSTAGFLATGLERGEACVLFGHDHANRRVLAALEDLGLGVSRLRQEERLLIASPSTSGEALLGALDDSVKSTIDRGVIGVRVLGNLRWGEAEWPVDEEILRLEARVTDAVRLYPAVVLCAYDVATVPARALHEGGFECHPLVLRPDALGPSDAYVPAERFLAKLERG
jgi:hypothetical protein